MALALQPLPPTLGSRPQTPGRSARRANQPARDLQLVVRLPGSTASARLNRSRTSSRPSPCLAVEVVDGVAQTEMLIETTAFGPALERAKRPRVRSDHNVRLLVGDRDEPDNIFRAVHQLVGPLLPDREPDDLALVKVARAVRCADARPPT